MSRYFNNKELELLAPAGNFEIFKGIINLGCDAVYFGGKNLNMRLHRKNYNFSDEELFEAVKMAHEYGKKAYITVNNMYNNEELDQLKKFLLLLGEVKPDALIVQDLSVIPLLKELNVNIPVHSSVMMNTHNLNSIYALKELGVTRVVLSRESSLNYSKYLSSKTDMELEYFVHGDMCVAHGSQCIYSGMLFGQSSNRGRCLKPCRWGYQVKQEDKESEPHFPLAVKDMFMYENIPELIDGGITSFKIEGRMRDLDYLTMIINAYSDAIDRYIDDPLSYDRTKDSSLLYENRKRDVSTAYAFGKPGLSNINSRYEGTGTLYSSGKVFSTATEERDITNEKIQKINSQLDEHRVNQTTKPRLSVKVNNIKQAKICLDLKVDDIYLSGDVFLNDKPFTKEEINELMKIKGDTKIYLAMPHMTFDSQFDEYAHILSKGLQVDGLLATNIGGVWAFKDYNLVGDYPMNILNKKAVSLYTELGLKRYTISPEANLSETISLLNTTGASAELIVHGSPTVMYMEHDLYDNVDQKNDSLLYLKDEAGFNHPIFKDCHGRNHMLLYKNICCLPILKGLYEAGLSHFRLEIAHLSEEEFTKIVTVYQKALKDFNACETLYEELKQEGSSFTLATLGL